MISLRVQRILLTVFVTIVVILLMINSHNRSTRPIVSDPQEFKIELKGKSYLCNEVESFP